MTASMHKVFISFHHKNDQLYKDALIDWNHQHGIFIDASVNTGDISSGLSDDSIRQKIRDEYLRDSTVTILLVGKETKYRDHVDWEIYSSMYDGRINKKSGLLVINLPSIGCDYYQAEHGLVEKNTLYPGAGGWITVETRIEFERRFPYMPERIVDNLLRRDALISVVNWDTITTSPDKLKLLIDLTFGCRSTCNYDLSRPMRRSGC